MWVNRTCIFSGVGGVLGGHDWDCETKKDKCSLMDQRMRDVHSIEACVLAWRMA
jgi:hypothetical protein